MEVLSALIGSVIVIGLILWVVFFLNVSERTVQTEDFFTISLISFGLMILLIIMLGISVKNTELISYRRILNGNSVVRTLDNCKFVVYVGNEDSENVITSLCKVEE